MFTKLRNLFKKRKNMLQAAYELQKVEFRNEHPCYVYNRLMDNKL